MSCRQCQGLESLFDHKTAKQDLKEYREKGPGKTTRLLIDTLKGYDITGATLLDIGGGVGAVQHELLKAGASQATGVDASAAYLNVAQTEAAQQGHAEQVDGYHGDFVELASDLPSADVVTLDRSVCCYPDMPALVGLSAQKAERLYGLVYPRDTWLMKIGASVLNTFFFLQRNPYRFFIHPSHAVDDTIQKEGLTRLFYQRTFFWQIVVYGRS